MSVAAVRWGPRRPDAAPHRGPGGRPGSRTAKGDAAMEATAVGIADAVRSGRMSARAATEQALERIAQRDGELLAFRTVRAERALAGAGLVDADPARGSLPLAGVPIAVKDNVAVAGEFTGNG